MFFLLLLIVLIVCSDQLTKWLAVIYLKNAEPLEVIPGILKFEYTENRGMAFGLLDGHRWVFMTVTSIVIVGLLIFLWRKPPKSKLCTIAIAFIIGGGFGNMIDRTLLGYVIDFIFPCMIPEVWPWIFNVADSFVTVGTGMLMVYLILDLVREIKKERAAKNGAERAATPDAAIAESDSEASGQATTAEGSAEDASRRDGESDGNAGDR